MIDGKVKGYFLFGQNPAVGAANGRAQRRAGQPRLAGRARPVRDRERRPSGRTRRRSRPARSSPRSSPPRSSSCRPPRTWRRRAPSPTPAAAAVARQGRRPAGRLPLATSGSSTTWAGASGRSCAGSTDPTRPAAARPGLGLPRRTARRRSPSAEAVLQEINGYETATGRPLSGLHRAEGRRLDRAAAAGSTAASTPTASTRPPRRKPRPEQPWVRPEWGCAWPANRRILYNRASADPDGRPWSERKKLRLVGRARPGAGSATTCPTSSRRSRRTTGPPEGATGVGRASPATTRSS